MADSGPFLLPAWHDGQRWIYHLERRGKQAFHGRLIYTARRLPDGAWRIEGQSEYPEGRSLKEWLEVAGEPLTQRAAFFERINTAGVYRYESRQLESGELWLAVESKGVRREERHNQRRGRIYIGNQLDFLLHGLDLTAVRPFTIQVRLESGKIYPFEVKIESREAVMVTDSDSVPAVLVAVRLANNPITRRLAPPVRYWFHPKEQTMLMRMDHGDTTLTLIEAE